MGTKTSHSTAGKMGYLASKDTLIAQKNLRILEYDCDPKLCPQCATPLAYDKRFNTFCSQSCAASYNNIGITRNSTSGTYKKKPCSVCGNKTKNRKFCSRNCNMVYRKKIMLQKILDGKYETKNGQPSIALKKYLVELRGWRCEVCKLSVWMEKPIPLNTHHKDGDATNNKLDNIQLICLNCHGQTHTYGNKHGHKSTRKYRYE